MRHDPYCRPPRHRRSTIQVECIHRIEVEIYPATGQVYFSDERFVDPACTQFRFDATVINAPSDAVHWFVHAVDGGIASGTIDAAGLYRAPSKNGHPQNLTEIVTARSVDDPTRLASAYITVTGHGPLPPPSPVIRLSPRRCTLYRPDRIYGRTNSEYIDSSNYHQTFTAQLFNSSAPILWKVDGVTQSLPSGSDTRKFTYIASEHTSKGLKRIRAELATDPTIYDEVDAMLTDYVWGGIWG